MMGESNMNEWLPDVTVSPILFLEKRYNKHLMLNRLTLFIPCLSYTLPLPISILTV